MASGTVQHRGQAGRQLILAIERQMYEASRRICTQLVFRHFCLTALLSTSSCRGGSRWGSENEKDPKVFGYTLNLHVISTHSGNITFQI